MPNYKADQISGWQRSPQIRILNRYQADRRVVFDEEILVVAGDTLITTPTGGLEESLTTLAGETIPRLNPETNEVIGTVDVPMMEVDVYSIYMFLAARRDAVVPDAVN